MESLSENGDFEDLKEEENSQTSGTAEKLVSVLMERNMTLSTAESCTGGLLAAKITAVPGVSAVYAGGFVTYATGEKHKMLGVPRKTLKELGAVAKKTAKQMAAGAAKKTGTDTAIAVTGNAGPDAMEGKPVGLVYIGVCLDGKASAKKFLFEGGRQSIREQAAEAGMRLLMEKINGNRREKT